MSKLKTVQNKIDGENGDNLPPKEYDLSVEGNLLAAEKKLESLGGHKEKRVTKNKGYLKCRMRKGRPYWYRVHKVKVDGEWKKKEIYIGTRKPRG
jgi:hypothetical protein